MDLNITPVYTVVVGRGVKAAVATLQEPEFQGGPPFVSTTTDPSRAF